MGFCLPMQSHFHATQDRPRLQDAMQALTSSSCCMMERQHLQQYCSACKHPMNLFRLLGELLGACGTLQAPQACQTQQTGSPLPQY